MKISKKNRTAGKYIFSGLFKSGVQILSNLVILRWINPEELGLWQSVTVFTGYVAILNIGVTTGINRELPFSIGQGNKERGIQLLSTAGAYVTILGIVLFFFATATGAILYMTQSISIQVYAFLILAIILQILNFQGNLLGATYRSSDSFNKLSNIQFLLSLLLVLLIPLIYFYKIWGYITYLILIAVITFVLYNVYKPFRVKYSFKKEEFKYLVKVGFPIFFLELRQCTYSEPPTISLGFGRHPLFSRTICPCFQHQTSDAQFAKIYQQVFVPKNVLQIWQTR